MTAEDIQLLAGCAANAVFNAGEMICHEGDEANRFYLLREGKVALEAFVPARGQVVLQTIGVGELVGWSWLIPPYRWRFDVRAVEAVRAIALDGQCLRGKCNANPRLGHELLKRTAQVLTERLLATRLQLLDVYGTVTDNPCVKPQADLMLPVPHRIERVRRKTHDVFTLELVPHDGAPVMHLAPGQFNMLNDFGAGEAVISISGDAAKNDRLSHTIRAVGTVTCALQRLKSGDVIGVCGPFGAGWPLLEAEGCDVVIVTGGIGLAPLRPVLYYVLANRGRFGRCALLYGAHTPRDLLYTRELKKWRGQFNLDVEITLDSATNDWHGNVGVDTTLIPRTPFDSQNAVAMICGPEVKRRFSVQELQRRGMRNTQIYVSMECNMKCAIGFCGHCQLGSEFVCKDGPVFRYDCIAAHFGQREI